MTEEQWDKLAAFIKSEARSAVSLNSAGEELARREYEEEARQALVKELQK